MKLLREAFVLTLIAAVAAVAAALFHPELKDWSRVGLRPFEIRLTTARHWAATVLWIDARSDDDYTRKHYPNALPLNEDDWNDQLPAILARWHPGMRIVVYCSSESCSTSEDVSRRLREKVGLPEVYFLHGGWETLAASHP